MIKYLVITTWPLYSSKRMFESSEDAFKRVHLIFDLTEALFEKRHIEFDWDDYFQTYPLKGLYMLQIDPDKMYGKDLLGKDKIIQEPEEL